MEPPMEPRSTVQGVADACGWRYCTGTFGGVPFGPRNAVLGVADACGRCHCNTRWSSLWGHGTLYWVWRAHAGGPAGAFGGAPYGATNRCTECGGRMRAVPLH
eukprot:6658525-Pyramimonas_sp.AAC.2